MRYKDIVYDQIYKINVCVTYINVFIYKVYKTLAKCSAAVRCPVPQKP